MPHSFTLLPAYKCRFTDKRMRVLVTGAAGNIGSYFAEHAPDQFDLRLMVHSMKKAEALRPFGEVVEGDVTDLDAMKQLCQGMDMVLHLAGAPSPQTLWDKLLQINFIGTYNTMVAAKSAGCRRVVYASSIHAVSGYPADVQVKTSDPVNPGDLYGVSKCFGEALGRYMAEQEGLSVIALRIGAFQPHESAENPDKGVAMMDAWVSRRDLHQLIEKCLRVEDLQYAIFNGLSDNRFKRLDISDARQLLDYAPQDDLTEVNPKLKDLDLSDVVAAHNLTDYPKESGIREDL